MSAIPVESETSPSQVVEDHHLRSLFMQHLITSPSDRKADEQRHLPPRFLVQFWDDANAIPLDVQECMNSWSALESVGFTRILFDDNTSIQFIKKHFDRRHVHAFQRCRHPAMRADYFRLCFIYAVGGFYVDADDVYLGQSVETLMSDGRLKLQPLCYDVSIDSMLDASVSASAEESEKRIFYVNNNPLIAPAKHPIIALALDRATSLVLSADKDSRDIQSLTGPGNITAALVTHAIELERADSEKDFVILTNWESIAKSKWPLEYRSGPRNWRHWVRANV